MKVLIVFAHPDTSSFNYALKESIKLGFTDSGCEIIESDLYRMNFKSHLDRYDYPSWDKETFRPDEAAIKASEDNSHAEDINIERQKITESSVIVFQFPIWWSNCPAILIGWIQRVFGYGFGYPDPVLRNKKILISCTAGNYSAADIDIRIRSQLSSFAYMGAEILPIIAVSPNNTLTEAERKQFIADAYNIAKGVAGNLSS
ncbi:unnamed protein product [Blepharisma stoltei]|uniref:Flavodoxin-like fold domain-containing protein n=1 Tax=Blepharisma stoltei TaxID=1481888 RepID=A0AAU9K7L1_9CILI|nr:unnamed protein product [Blepharisma stoltei]